MGLRQLCIKLVCTQLTKDFVAEMSCNVLLIDTAMYLQFVYSEEHSNEPLRHYIICFAPLISATSQPAHLIISMWFCDHAF